MVRACLRAPHVVADEAKLAIVFTYFFLFGPGGLHTPLLMADGSIAGHCFHLLFGLGGLHAPHVVVDGSEADYYFH